MYVELNEINIWKHNEKSVKDEMPMDSNRNLQYP